MEEVSEPLTPLALLWTRRAAGFSEHRPSAIKRPRLFPASFFFAASIKTLLQFSHRSRASFEADWQEGSGRNLVPARQTRLFPLLCPEHIPLLVDISLPVPEDWRATGRAAGETGKRSPCPPH